jgi:signal peptide peptidase SppA
MPLNELSSGVSFADLPLRQAHIAEYSDIWLIEPARGQALLQSIRGILSNWSSHFTEWQTKHAERAAAGRGGALYATTADGVAVIELAGTLMKQQQSGGESTSTILARRALRLAVRDADVKSILLLIDSPGGTAAGTADLADDVAAADKLKPVDAYIQDCGCSAAYWIASQCRTIATNRTSATGSLSTYTVVEDFSEAAAKEGIKVHVVKADGAPFKGAGVPGSEITPEQLAEVGKRVNAVNAHFMADIARGRKWSAEQLKQLADGRIFTGEEARTLGLVDRVESLDATLGAIAQRIKQTTTQRGTKAMSTDVTKPERVAATLAELEASCPGSTPEFLLAQLKAGATVAEAMSSLIVAQTESLKQATERATVAEEKLKAEPPKRPGNPMPTEGAKGPNAAGATADPQAAWNEALKAEIAGGKTKAQAIAALAKSQPELHTAWVNSVNSAVGRPTFKS